MARDHGGSDKSSPKIDRLIFFGAGLHAVLAFEALVAAGYKILALVNDSAADGERGPETVAGPWRIPVFSSEDAASREFEKQVRTLAPDVQVVVEYRRPLPKGLSEIPRRGTIQLHPSLLPRHRGDFPVQSAILAGDSETGVTVAVLTDKLDCGPVLMSRTLPIGPEETAGEVVAKLGPLGAQVLLGALQSLDAGTLAPVPQDAARASESPKVGPDTVALDWKVAAEKLARQVRAFNPWPGVVTQGEGLDLRILRCAPAGASGGEEPGTLVRSSFDGLYVACGEKTLLRVIQLQPEGQRPMSPSGFVAKYRLAHGARFE